MKIIRMKEVKNMTGFCQDWIYKLERRGDFPKKVKMGERATGWVLSEVEDFIQEKIDAR